MYFQFQCGYGLCAVVDNIYNPDWGVAQRKRVKELIGIPCRPLLKYVFMETLLHFCSLQFQCGYGLCAVIDNIYNPDWGVAQRKRAEELTGIPCGPPSENKVQLNLSIKT